MSRPNSNDIRKLFREEEKAILDIIIDWEPIGFITPYDEYDCPAYQLLSILHAMVLTRTLRTKYQTKCITTSV
jgi:hypothetical protein